MVTIRSVPVAERRARLGIRHHLAGSAKATDPVAVAHGLVAYHATAPASVYLAARARIDGLAQETVSAALYDDRSLVRMLGMRRTMFVVPTPFVPVVQHSSSDAVATRLRARLVKDLAEVVADPGAWLDEVGDAVVEILRETGPAMAADIAKAEPRLRTQLMIAAREGLRRTAGGHQPGAEPAVRAEPDHPGPAEQRLGRQPLPVGSRRGVAAGRHAPDPDAAARAQLVERWLARFGPGTLRDLVWWTGWNQRDTKAALAELDVVEVDLDGQTGLLLATDTDPVATPEPWLAFLPELDPTPMGWFGREWYLPAAHRRCCSTPTATSGRPSGATGGSSAAGRRAQPVTSAGGCWRTSAPRTPPGSRRRQTR